MKSLCGTLSLLVLCLGCTQPSQPATSESSPTPPPAASDELEGAEARSLLGVPLYPPPLPPDLRADREAKLEAARAEVAANPDSPEAHIWHARRTAYLGNYRAAVSILDGGIERFPEDARFLRHRGHRYLTLRRPDLAERDLVRAAEMEEGRPDRVEPDGLPNARNIPTSTLQTNIWYHLGLAYYLQREFSSAVDAFERCHDLAANDDMEVAALYWLYMSLRRDGQQDEASAQIMALEEELDIIENHSYHRLLLFFRGSMAQDELIEAEGDDALASATVGYGIGNWNYFGGRPEAAERVWREVVSGQQWAAFGFLAAEAELAFLEEAAGR